MLPSLGPADFDETSGAKPHQGAKSRDSTQHTASAHAPNGIAKPRRLSNLGSGNADTHGSDRQTSRNEEEGAPGSARRAGSTGVAHDRRRSPTPAAAPRSNLNVYLQPPAQIPRVVDPIARVTARRRNSAFGGALDDQDPGMLPVTELSPYAQPVLLSLAPAGHKLLRRSRTPATGRRPGKQGNNRRSKTSAPTAYDRDRPGMGLEGTEPAMGGAMYGGAAQHQTPPYSPVLMVGATGGISSNAASPLHTLLPPGAAQTVWLPGPDGRPMAVPASIYLQQALAAAGLSQMSPPRTSLSITATPIKKEGEYSAVGTPQPAEQVPAQAPADEKVDDDDDGQGYADDHEAPEGAPAAATAGGAIIATSGPPTAEATLSPSFAGDGSSGSTGPKTVSLSFKLDLSALPANAQAALAGQPSLRLVLVADDPAATAANAAAASGQQQPPSGDENDGDDASSSAPGSGASAGGAAPSAAPSVAGAGIDSATPSLILPPHTQQPQHKQEGKEDVPGDGKPPRSSGRKHRSNRPLPVPPPTPAPVDDADRTRAASLAHAVLVSQARNGAAVAASRRASVAAGGPALPRPVPRGFPLAYAYSRFTTGSSSMLHAGAHPSSIEAAVAGGLSSWASNTVAWESCSDAEVSGLMASLPPDLKHPYPTRLLVSLVADLCEEIQSNSFNANSNSNSSSYSSQGAHAASTSGPTMFGADLASAWLWFLQLSRDIRSSWASGTRWAIRRRKDRAAAEGSSPRSTKLRQEAMAILQGQSPIAEGADGATSTAAAAAGSSSSASGGGGARDSALSEEEVYAREILSTGLHSSSPSTPAAAAAADGGKAAALDADTEAVARDAVYAAETVYEPFGEVVQEDHILRLLKRLQLPSLESKALFVRAALAFAGWGSLNDAAATVMRTHLDENRASAKPKAKEATLGTGTPAQSSLNIDVDADGADAEADDGGAAAVERDMEIVEAVLLEPVTLAPASALAVCTVNGIRVGPGMVITPAEAKASVASNAASISSPTAAAAAVLFPSSSSSNTLNLASTTSTSSAHFKSFGDASSTLSASINGYSAPIAPRGLTGGAFNGPVSVEGMRLVPVFGSSAWQALLYVRGRACAPHNLEAIFSTPSTALALHYAFVRQCLAEPPSADEIQTLADAALVRAHGGRSPAGATVRSDPIAESEDAGMMEGCPLPPGRQYYPVRYLLALVQSLLASIGKSRHETPAAAAAAAAGDAAPESSPTTDGATAVASAGPPLPAIDGPAMRACWFFFLQLRRDMASTWAAAHRWLQEVDGSAAGVVNTDAENTIDGHQATSAGVPTDYSAEPALTSYTPFGEVAQMDHVLRLLERIPLPHVESKSLFVRTALAFCGWGGLEDAAATIMRSHLEELAMDQADGDGEEHGDLWADDAAAAAELATSASSASGADRLLSFDQHDLTASSPLTPPRAPVQPVAPSDAAPSPIALEGDSAADAIMASMAHGSGLGGTDGAHQLQSKAATTAASTGAAMGATALTSTFTFTPGHAVKHSQYSGPAVTRYIIIKAHHKVANTSSISSGTNPDESTIVDNNGVTTVTKRVYHSSAELVTDAASACTWPDCLLFTPALFAPPSSASAVSSAQPFVSIEVWQRREGGEGPDACLGSTSPKPMSHLLSAVARCANNEKPLAITVYTAAATAPSSSALNTSTGSAAADSSFSSTSLASARLIPLGSLTLTQASVASPLPRLVDYLRGGMKLNTIFAVDFSGSSGAATTSSDDDQQEAALKAKAQRAAILATPTATALAVLGSLVQRLCPGGRMIPYGYGAAPSGGDNGNEASAVGSSELFLLAAGANDNGSKDNEEDGAVTSVSGLLEAYAAAAGSVAANPAAADDNSSSSDHKRVLSSSIEALLGLAWQQGALSPLSPTAADAASKRNQQQQQHHSVLFLLTHGPPSENDREEMVNRIAGMHGLPVTIIIVPVAGAASAHVSDNAHEDGSSSTQQRLQHTADALHSIVSSAAQSRFMTLSPLRNDVHVLPFDPSSSSSTSNDNNGSSSSSIITKAQREAAAHLSSSALTALSDQVVHTMLMAGILPAPVATPPEQAAGVAAAVPDGLFAAQQAGGEPHLELAKGEGATDGAAPSADAVIPSSTDNANADDQMQQQKPFTIQPLTATPAAEVQEQAQQSEGNANAAAAAASSSTDPLDIEAAMFQVETALTASIRLVPWSDARQYGRGGLKLTSTPVGMIVGLTDVGREMAVNQRYPPVLGVQGEGPHYDPSSLRDDATRPLETFAPPSWHVLAHVRDRAGNPGNLEVIASTPPEALQVHYDFLRQCLSGPVRFDRVAFEAQETSTSASDPAASGGGAGASAGFLHRDADVDADLAGLLVDRSGAQGPLLTAAMRTEIASLLGWSTLRAAVSASVPAPGSIGHAGGGDGDASTSHPSDLDGQAIKVVFLVAKDDGRSPLLDPATKQPIMVRSTAPLEEAEAVMARVGKAGRRLAMAANRSSGGGAAAAAAAGGSSSARGTPAQAPGTTAVSTTMLAGAQLKTFQSTQSMQGAGTGNMSAFPSALNMQPA